MRRFPFGLLFPFGLFPKKDTALLSRKHKKSFALRAPAAFSRGMGFFDRSNSNKKNTAQPAAAANANAANANADAPADAPDASAETSRASAIHAQLLAANEKLKAGDLAAAMTIYEELLRAAGDRADVLVTISADLGTAGHIPQIIELVAPRYDAEKHGPATGLNLLQAYLAVRNTTAAQHLLDILFALNRADLEERLYGFSNALGELIEAEKRGELPLPSPGASAPGPDGRPAPARKSIHLVSISRPIWSYGLEAIPATHPPDKHGNRLRRVAFAQISMLGLADEELAAKTAQPEDAPARFTRGLPLWLAETFCHSPHYSPIAALALIDSDSYAIFPIEWTPDHITQLVNTSGNGLDYIFTGALRQKDAATELLLRVWEVKKLRERKQFSATFTPETAAAALAALHAQILQFMEWRQDPAAPAYLAPASATGWCDTLGASLGFFLADKGVLPLAQLADPAGSLARAASRAAGSERDSYAYLTLAARARRLGLAASLPAPALAATPLVEQARQALA